MQLLDYDKAASLLKRYGIKSIQSTYVDNSNAAVKFAKGEPIVLKLISDKALHKAKAGLVKLNLYENKKIESAYRELENKGKKLKPYKIQAQKMAKSGVEIIIGGRRDSQFGPLILIGLGGIYVETFKDFALRVCPITKFDAEEMLAQMKSKKIVTYDGEAQKEIVQLLLKVSKMMENNDFEELDLNPTIIRRDGYDVVDIRILR